MKHQLKQFVVALTLGTALTTPVQAACWSEAAVSAAKVRDLETMLMVSSLRCKAANNALLTQYNRFVRDSRTALTAVNDTLRSQFVNSGGLNAYDRYVTAIANRYGAGAEGLSCNDMTSILSAAEAAGGSLAGLTRLANDAGVEPKLAGTRCSRAIAAVK